MINEKTKEKIPPLSHLHYKRNDLIIKEGDYGVSIYEIINGQVGIFIQSGDTEVGVATLGQGEIFGEMTLFTNSITLRSASARALVDAEIAVYHPARLKKRFEEMPPIIKYITGQTINRLIRMNMKLTKLKEKKEESKKLLENSSQFAPGISRRRFHRKKLDQDCVYHPVGALEKVTLWGRIFDICKDGLRLDVSKPNLLTVPHKIGDEFFINTSISKGKRLDIKAKTLHVNNHLIPKKISLGMSFTHLTKEARRDLGFFLLSSAR